MKLPVCTCLKIAAGLLLVCSAAAQQADENDGEQIRATARPQAAERSPDLRETAQIVVQLTNEFRETEGSRAVRVNPRLSAAARQFAQYMAETDRYGHTADGRRPSERAADQDYEFCLVSENIAYQYSSRGLATEDLAERFVQGWQDSPGHRRNMLDDDLTETGVAVARSEQTGFYYAVQMFGRPAADRIEFSIENRSGDTVEYRLGDQSFSLPPRYIRTHQRCRPSELAFPQEDDEDDRIAPVRPRDGDHLTIVVRDGKLRIERQ